MAIFNRDPQKAMQRDIDAAKANLTRLRAQLGEAEAAITQHREQAKIAAVTGADSLVLDAAESLVRNAQDRRETFSAAVIEVESNLAALERAKSEAIDKARREATAQSCELLARRVIESAEVMVKAAAAFAVHIEKASAIAPESAGLLNFAVIVGREIPGAVDQTSKLLRQHAAAVIAGSAPSAMPQPPEPYVPPVAPLREPTAQLFCLRSVRWLDEFGVQKLGAQFNDIELPQRLAARALACGACIPVSDPRRRHYHTQGGPPPNAATCTDIDAVPEPAEAEPMASPQRLAAPIKATPPEFVAYDRGPATVLKIATPRL